MKENIRYKIPSVIRALFSEDILSCVGTPMNNGTLFENVSFDWTENAYKFRYDKSSHAWGWEDNSILYSSGAIEEQNCWIWLGVFFLWTMSLRILQSKARWLEYVFVCVHVFLKDMTTCAGRITLSMHTQCCCRLLHPSIDHTVYTYTLGKVRHVKPKQ